MKSLPTLTLLPFSLSPLISYNNIKASHKTIDAPNQTAMNAWHQHQLPIIESFISSLHTTKHAERLVAVFDWDNTVIKNDIGDAFFMWMVLNNKIKQPPQGQWQYTSSYLTKKACQKLEATCSHLAKPGQVLPTNENIACLDEILSIYRFGKTLDGQSAFENFNKNHMQPQYAWAAQLLAGYSSRTIKTWAHEVFQSYQQATYGTTLTIGSHQNIQGFIRFNKPIVALIKYLRQQNIEVWIVSASAQSIVEACAQQLKIPSKQIIGIRNEKSTKGTLTYQLQGCGPFLNTTNQIITYRDGKRCWINNTIFNTHGELAMQPNADMTKRPILGAGDSITDSSFLSDVNGLRIIIDRNEEILKAMHNQNPQQWLMQPQFYHH